MAAFQMHPAYPAPLHFAALAQYHYDNLGVDWRIQPQWRGGWSRNDCPKRPSNAWYFSHFRRYDSYPKGNGRKALLELCELADSFGIRIDLDTYTEPKLHAFYRSIGFRKAPKGYHYSDHGFTRKPADKNQPAPVFASTSKG